MQRFLRTAWVGPLALVLLGAAAVDPDQGPAEGAGVGSVAID